MADLKKFYADAEKNEELKKALIEANKELEGTTDLAAAQAKVIEVAKKFGYDLAAEDFEEKEGELDLDDLDAVAGGIGGCFVVNAGCQLFGEIEKGGCIIIGTHA